MARQKITKWFADEAARRLAAMQTIDPALDLGGGLTLTAFSASIDNSRARTLSYNQSSAIADENRVVAIDTNKKLKQLASRYLSAIAGRYGKDSEEYAKAGGTRTSERQKRKKQKPSSQAGEHAEN